MINSQTNPYPIEPGEAVERFRPIVFGEALFDYFPDGSRVLGGAPFNVAWHLRGFKADPLMITAVGRDGGGTEILGRMGSWGMDSSGVQTHPSRPTGRVTAHLVGDQPHYDIEARQAYDAIQIDELPALQEIQGSALLYHGSLGVREEASAATLEFLKEELRSPVLVDVNLRDPWWSLQNIPGLVRGADWVKVNREEAGALSGCPVGTRAQLLEGMAVLSDALAIGTLVVTLGAEGALASTGKETIEARAPEVVDTVDTVGAGDAFSAVLALGIHGNWPLETILRRAADFAGELCRIRGAVPTDPGLYARHQERWIHAP